tara:strand:+ start:9194 stop:10051 length:858 start_codon:yes stop_codon:yes gene_type:complete
MSFNTTSLPEYVDTVVFQTSAFYQNSSNLLNIFNDYLNELNLNLDYEKGKSSGDIFETNVTFFEKLNNDNFIIDNVEIDDIFKNYYIEKYNSLFSSLKTSVSGFLGDKNIYFKNYSDDVGILSDNYCVLDDSIVPWYDIFNEDIEIPNNLNSTIFNKVTDNNKNLQLKFSKFNNAILKNNLKGIVDYTDVNKVKTSHGFNLMTDYVYYQRLFKYKEPIAQNISKILKGLGNYILFIKNTNKRQNSTKASIFAFDAKVEEVTEQIDILKNKITSTVYTSNTILSAT